jgi:hypothetical protein
MLNIRFQINNHQNIVTILVLVIIRCSRKTNSIKTNKCVKTLAFQTIPCFSHLGKSLYIGWLSVITESLVVFSFCVPELH